MEFYIIPAVAVATGVYSYQKAKKKKMSQAAGFAIMPGLWFGALFWCLLTGQFDLVFLVVALVGMFLAYVYFFAK
jgi:UDP-N-acetylmuramyl pentapeptide phosphotransferase/UDP-N-acetylglucosamine-1-phosphate transferase